MGEQTYPLTQQYAFRSPPDSESILIIRARQLAAIAEAMDLNRSKDLLELSGKIIPKRPSRWVLLPWPVSGEHHCAGFGISMSWVGDYTAQRCDPTLPLRLMPS
jgi:hypothetical protein